jgi:hypothetical protein
MCMFCRSLFVLLYFFLWPLCCLFFFDKRILITPLAIVLSVLLWYTDSDYTFGHCVVCSSLIYGFWLHLWPLCCLLLWYTDYNYTFGHCVVCSSLKYGFWLHLWPLCCLFFFDIRILITPLISFCLCVVCSSLIYGFWLHLWYLVVLVLSVLLWYTDSDYTFGILWPLCCLVLFNMRILIPPLVSCGHCFVSSSLIYGFWLHHWYLVTIVVSVLLWYTDSDYTFGILWPLRCLIFFDIRILITPLVSSNFS